MALEAIKSDLDPEINYRKSETARVPGYQEPRKLRLTKVLEQHQSLAKKKNKLS